MKFKDDIVAARFEDMNKIVQQSAELLDEYIHTNHGIHITLTSTVSTKEEDDLLGRKSDTHRTRRAYDIRTRGLDEHIVEDIVKFLQTKYGFCGAITSNGPTIVVDKSKTSQPHLHVQFNRNFALKELNYGKA